MPTNTTPQRFEPHLDAMLTPDQAAEWLQIPKRTLAQKSTGRRAEIPCFRPSPRFPRYHPRTIIAKLAQEAGVKPEIIAASLGINLAP